MKTVDIYLDSKYFGKQLNALKKGDGHQIYLDSRENDWILLSRLETSFVNETGPNEPPPAGVRSTQCLGVEYSEILEFRLVLGT